MTDFEPKQKEDFAAVYDLPDPRPYYRGLTATHYRMPEVMAGVVERITERLLAHRAGDDRALQVLDFACGFGAVGALLKHSLSMSSLYAHYADDPSDGLDIPEPSRRCFDIRLQAVLGMVAFGMSYPLFLPFRLEKSLGGPETPMIQLLRHFRHQLGISDQQSRFEQGCHNGHVCYGLSPTIPY